MNLFSVNGPPRLYQINLSDGGVPKLPVPRARITIQGVEGDQQRNPAIHGGPNRAVCLFSLEVIEALQAEGHFIAPGSSGENLTLAGIDWPSLKPGDRLAVGEVVLEVASYTAPCVHNAQWFRDGDFSRISHKKYPGWSRVYARVITEGVVRPGDPVNIDKRVSDQPSTISSDVRNRS
jgi:MOSC domain-containing protein YiiM